MTQPNIVILMVDQWRADCFGSSGHPVVETPTIDLLFRHGTIFDRAYASVPSCIAARASLLTGLSQAQHGRVGYHAEVAWEYPFTFASLLADAGYQCHAVGKMHVWPARKRMGFHDIELHDGYLHDERRKLGNYDLVDDYRPWLRQQTHTDADIIDQALGCNGYDVRPWDLDDRLHPNSWAVSRSVDFLRRRDPTRPFLLKLSLHRPHPPLDPPRWAWERYSTPELPPVVTGDWNPDIDEPRAGDFLDSVVPTTARGIDRARRAYYAQLTAIDQEFNRMIHALGEYGVLENTAFLLLGDHGEMLFDHHRAGKTLPYEPSARIPLMLRLPGGHHPVQRSSAIVELRDVLPTLCDLAGAPTPPTVAGSSLLSVASGEQSTVREHLHGEHFNWALSAHRDDNQWITNDRYKYVWFTQTGTEQLFDLSVDPAEQVNLADSDHQALAPLRALLVDALTDREEGYVAGGELVAGRIGRGTLEAANVLSNAQRDAQRATLSAIAANKNLAGTRDWSRS